MFRNEKNIFLTGCMGAGKTTVGKLLASYLGIKFVDIDMLVEERVGMNVLDIFEKMGEKKFRKIETDIISDMVKYAGQVIALGGGAVLSRYNRELIGKSSFSVYLKAEAETLCSRVNTEVRPLLRSLNRSETPARMQRILDERELYYEEANIIVCVDNKTLQEVVDAIMERMKSL